MRILSVISVLVLCFSIVACGGQSESSDQSAATAGSAEHSESAVDATQHAEQHAEHAEEAAAAALSYAVGDKVELTGVAGCGHCTYHIGDGCSMAMEADGVVYILDGIDADTEAFNQRMSGKSITVVGTLSSDGEPAHIQVESHQM